MNIHLPLSYSTQQNEIFWQDQDVRFKIVKKGRRFGFTHGALQYLVEQMIDNVERILWVDTVYSNINQYYNLILFPILQKLPRSLWRWNKSEHILYIGNSHAVFRSADRPENIEGFDYELIFINEAGIVLHDVDLYYKSIMPMMIGMKPSRMIIGGAPKGMYSKKTNDGFHLFYKLYNEGLTKPDMYKCYSYTSYECIAGIPLSSIDEIKSVMDEITQRQEIYAEFVDASGMKWLYTFDKDKHVSEKAEYEETKTVYIGFDFNVNPFACVLAQRGQREDGGRYIHYFDNIVITDKDVKLGETYIEAICRIIKHKTPLASKYNLYYVSGDRSGSNRNLTQKVGENTFTEISRALGISENHFNLARSNPLYVDSHALCNSIFSKHPEILIHPRCEELIRDCSSAMADSDHSLVKGNRNDPIQQLDVFDGMRYDLHAWDSDFINY